MTGGLFFPVFLGRTRWRRPRNRSTLVSLDATPAEIRRAERRQRKEQARV